MQKLEYHRTAGRNEHLPVTRRVGLDYSLLRTATGEKHISFGQSDRLNLCVLNFISSCEIGRIGLTGIRLFALTIICLGLKAHPETRVAALIHAIIKQANVPANGISFSGSLNICLTSHRILIVA